MLLLSSICNGQSWTNFGANSPNNFSKTLGKLWVVPLGSGGDTSVVWVNDSGVFYRIPIATFRGIVGTTYTAGYGLLLTGNIFRVDSSKFATVYANSLKVNASDTAVMLSPYLRRFAPGTAVTVGALGANTLNVTNQAVFQDGVEMVDLPSQEGQMLTTLSGIIGASSASTDDLVMWGDTTLTIATQYDLSLVTVSGSNGSMQKSATPTTTIPTQSAAMRYTDLRASTNVPAPYVWWIVDTPYVVLTGALIDTFRDASGNNRTAYQATTANKATWNASGGMNNLSYAAFHSTSANPAKYSSATITLDTVYTLFFVFKMTESASGSNEFLLGTSANSCLVLGQRSIGIFLGGANESDIYIGATRYVVLEVQRKGRVTQMFTNSSKGGAVYNNNLTATFNWSGIGGNIGTLTQFPAFNFHELLCYNTLLSQEQIQNVRNYLYGKYGGRYGTLYAFGDSWTEGTGSSNVNGTSWSTRLATALGYNEINQGIGGSVLESIAIPQNNNGYDRRANMPYLPSVMLNNGYAIIMYGGNDANNAATTSYNPILYRFQLSTVVNQLLDYGWKRGQVILSTQGRFTGASTGRWDSFANACMDVARQMNMRSLDLRTFFGANIANNGSIGGNGVHPTTTQNDTIARLFQSVIMTDYVPTNGDTTSAPVYYPIPNQRPAVFIGSTSTWTLPPITGNKGYVIDISNAGTGAITVNSFAGGNDIFTTAATNTVTLNAGDVVRFYNTGTYWKFQ